MTELKTVLMAQTNNNMTPMATKSTGSIAWMEAKFGFLRSMMAIMTVATPKMRCHTMTTTTWDLPTMTTAQNLTKASVLSIAGMMIGILTVMENRIMTMVTGTMSVNSSKMVHGNV